MFEKLLGKNKKGEEKSSELATKVSKMNLSEMRSYVNNKVTSLAVSKDGIEEVMKRLTKIDEKSSQLYLQADDMDSKKKKGFDLVLLICKNIHMSVEIVELLQEFIVVYEELIDAYDKEHKDIYASRFKDAIGLAIENVNKQSALSRKTDVLGG